MSPVPVDDGTPGGTVRVVADGQVRHVVIDRPPVNALDVPLMRSIIAAFDQVGEQSDAAVVVLSARGRVFCAGADIRGRHDPLSPGEATARARLSGELHASIAECPVPVVVAVDGPAIGGGLSLVAAADVVVVGPRTVVALPEVDVGMLGGAAWAARLLGPRWARRLMLTGERMPVADLLATGSFAAAVLAEDALGRATEIARALAMKSPTALRLAKQALNDVEHLDARAGYRREQTFAARLLAHPDSAEASRAFLEKWPPRFDPA